MEAARVPIDRQTSQPIALYTRVCKYVRTYFTHPFRIPVRTHPPAAGKRCRVRPAAGARMGQLIDPFYFQAAARAIARVQRFDARRLDGGETGGAAQLRNFIGSKHAAKRLVLLLGHAPRRLEDALLNLVLQIVMQRVIEDHLGTRTERRNILQRGTDDVARQILRNTQPRYEHASLRIDPRFAQDVPERHARKIRRIKRSLCRGTQPGVAQPGELGRLRGRVIDFENPQFAVTASQTKGIESRSEHDVLPAPMRDRIGEPILGIAAAGRHECAAARRKTPARRFRIGAQASSEVRIGHSRRKRIVENRRNVEHLMRRTMHRHELGGSAKTICMHGDSCDVGFLHCPSAYAGTRTSLPGSLSRRIGLSLLSDRRKAIE